MTAGQPLLIVFAMRVPVLSLLALFLAGCTSMEHRSVRTVEIKEILPRYMEEADFIRISEYLDAREHLGSRTVVRSQPDVRDGYYFVLVLDTKLKKLPPGTRVLAEIAGPVDGPVEFDLSLPKRRTGSRELFVGLTGADWPDVEAVPSAWRFTLMDANGQVLGSRHSYLWAL